MTTNCRKLATAMFAAAMFIGLCIAQAGGQESNSVPQAKGGKSGVSKNAGADKKDAKVGVKADDAKEKGDPTQRAALGLREIDQGNIGLDKTLGGIEEMIRGVQLSTALQNRATLALTNGPPSSQHFFATNPLRR